MISYLYSLIVQPLVFVIEIIFSFMYRLIGNEGLSILMVSIVVNFLILPLYRRADAVQEEERDKQASMEGWVSHIKKTFHGDEQYMMLTTYYRQQNYQPLQSLRSSISLLLQIPFFIAAYRYLSELSLLEGAAFGPIADLSLPDGMITVGSMTINILPILMTVVNLISGAIYSKGLPLKSKIQQYALTILFLVLLYKRPSGLVLYWTMNNVFSLVKNLFLKVIKKPEKILAVLASAAGIVFVVLLARNGSFVSRKRVVLVAAMCLITQIPLLRLLWKATPAGKAAMNREKKETKALPWTVFLLIGIFLTLLIGVMIPLSIVSDAPADFIDPAAYVNPIRFVVNTFFIAAGFFLLWGNIFYFLATPKVKNLFTLAFASAGVAGLINYMFFGKNLGDISTDLVFDVEPVFSRMDKLINAAIVLAVIGVIWLIWKHRSQWLTSVFIILSVGVIGLCAVNVHKMNEGIADIPNLVSASERRNEEIEPVFRLSTKGQNVIVLMLDRSVNAMLKYIVHERPEMKEQLSGFTWYPNTMSFAPRTASGSPAVYGGYEYTPMESNKRDEESLKQKQNEALKVMPVIFSNEGYEVTVCDPSFANYHWTPDCSIYDEYPGIKALNLAGKYAFELKQMFGSYYESTQRRNFFFYSIFKIAPLALQQAIYDNGVYYSTANLTTVSNDFIANYSTLQHLIDITEITDEDVDTFLMMANKTTHEETMLQMPDYVPAVRVDNSEFDNTENYTVDGVTMEMETERQITHYHVNMATFLLLGKWFDYMKEQGVYDNTRIIICGDHGAVNLEQFDYMWVADGKINMQMFNPQMVIKDFNETGELDTSYDYMTNADVPLIATTGTVENAVNPFTGKPISNDAKKDPKVVTSSLNWRLSTHRGNTYKEDRGRWFEFYGEDIFDADNWIAYKTWEDIEANLVKEGLWP